MGNYQEAIQAFETSLTKLADQEACELARAQLAFTSFLIDHRPQVDREPDIPRIFDQALQVFKLLGSKKELVRCRELQGKMN